MYHPYIEEMVVRKLGAKEARVFEHQVRCILPRSMTWGDVGMITYSSFDIDIRGLVNLTPEGLCTTILP